jgi:diguanylate cyclase (GGDEF)-like protein
MNEANLSAVLSQFAHTLATDFPIQTILDHLVTRIAEILPITCAGVTLISDGVAPHYIAASDEAALRFETLQTDVGEGPCSAAFDTGEAVLITDMATDTRFPRFAPAAAAAGLAAAFTFPLRHSGGRLGALDLYRDTPGVLSSRDLYAAQTLADVTTAYLLNAQARATASAASEDFRRSSLHDPLTGLPNRLLLQQRLTHAAQRARRSHTHAAVLFVDLDLFKRINDSYGHHAGDELLRAVAHRLTGLVRPGDTLARVSGHEFVVLCEDLHDVADAELLATRIGTSFHDPFSVAGTDVVVTASVGLAFAGPGESVTQQHIELADAAMYQAKRMGGARHQVLDLEAAHETAQQRVLERDLATALANGALDLAYQPIVTSKDGTMVGVEALLRWTDPGHGTVPPLTMIDIAERTGLIIDLGDWVLERACRDRGDWQDTSPAAPVTLAVNVSARQLASAGFADRVASILARTSMDPHALVLEVTESVFAETDRAEEVLAELKRIGVRIALDDFGTGYSSLSYLDRFPVDFMKVDRGFVSGLPQQDRTRTIVAAVSDLAHGLGSAVTAEGVETAAERDAVVDIGCEYAQGYFFARPMTATALRALVRTGRGRHPTLPSVRRSERVKVAEPAA